VIDCGSIDRAEVKDAIIEGGIEALRLRRERYGF